MKSIILLWVVVSCVLSGCLPAASEGAPTTQVPLIGRQETPTGSPTRSPTAAPTRTQTPAHTLAPTQTHTPSPSPTPRLHLPINAGTPLPEIDEFISENTIRDLKALAHLTLDIEATDFIWEIAISPSNAYMAVGTSLGKIQLWDLRNLVHVDTIEAHPSGVWGLAFSPDGSTLISGADSVKLWEVPTGALLNEIDTGPVISLAISPDGKMIGVGTDGWKNPQKGALIYSLEDLSLLHRIAAKAKPWIRFLEFSRDGSWIVISATDDKFGIYDLTAKEWSDIIFLSGWEDDLNFYLADLSYDNRYIAVQISANRGSPLLGGSTTDGTIIWDIHDQRVIADFPGLSLPRFSQSSDLLFGQDAGGNITAWSTSSYSMIREIEEFRSFTLSPDGRLMITSKTPSIHILGIYP